MRQVLVLLKTFTDRFLALLEMTPYVEVPYLNYNKCSPGLNLQMECDLLSASSTYSVWKEVELMWEIRVKHLNLTHIPPDMEEGEIGNLFLSHKILKTVIPANAGIQLKQSFTRCRCGCKPSLVCTLWAYCVRPDSFQTNRSPA